ncbi:Imm1 family immunity protein [Lentzea albidocapillata]|uniref:Immunity protein Imm1 n=1 Tax=Lentzea albidocapillata TaxID=40571 RepID=A0A1W2FL81_9PSEU|nr:Imm1 family immunity protein [Lentzea albidocapillata]SMD22650.1 Immunity protein Imm1 [Lentzea albidocapillata]
MRNVLDAYYFTPGNRGRESVTVDSPSKLDQVLAEIVANRQPQPTVVYVRGRPKTGLLQLPDHQLKFDVDVTRGVAAIHAMGPSSFVAQDNLTATPKELRDRTEADAEDSEMRAWVTLWKDSSEPATPASTADDGDIALYVDVDTRTRFPTDAAIPLEKLREALQEFAETGRRPTCVDWQESDVF